jgi:transcriptional repressor NrdR
VHCPFCRHPDSRVVDSREADDGAAIRRRRACPECGRRFTTVETASLTVLKRSGATEPFSRAKVIDGVRKACSGRPVGDDALAVLAQQVEETVRASGCAEVAAHEIGLAILSPLRDLDEVAYLRFASVYRGFDCLDDYLAEIVELRAGQPAADMAAVDIAPDVAAYDVQDEAERVLREAEGPVSAASRTNPARSGVVTSEGRTHR